MSDARASVGMDPMEWAMCLCRFLIKYKARIQSELQQDGRYQSFCDAIDLWRKEHVNNPQSGSSQQACERTTTALEAVCQQYGLLQLMESENALEEIRISRVDQAAPGAVRVRGTFPSLITVAEVEQELKEVGRSFGGVD